MNLLAALIKDRHTYNLAVEAGVSDVLDDKSKMVLKEVHRYYKLDTDATHVDLTILSSRLEQRYPKHVDVFKAIVSTFEEAEVSLPNIQAEIKEERKRTLKLQLASAFTLQGNDRELLEKLEDYRRICYDEDDDESSGLDTVYNCSTVADVLGGREGANRIALSPKSLNDAAGGGVLRKHHILIFARPDAGKSTVAINMVGSFLHQGLKVLYVGNEDPPNDILLRLMCRLTQRTEADVAADPDGTMQILGQRNWEQLTFIEGNPGTARELEAWMDEHQPDVLLVDQVRNLDMKEDSRVLSLEKAEQFVRNLGKRYNALTISFTQAGGSAEGKLILDMCDVDFSNTGMQASADLMVGLGTNAEYTQNGQRVLTCVKNKLPGGSKEPFRVSFDYNHHRVY